jgi:hypothetical protein
MGIALLTFSSLLQGLSVVQRAVASGSHPASPSNARSADHGRSGCINTRINSPFHRPVQATTLSSGTGRPAGKTPLRVVRMSESGERPDAAGRMVISGRMADVCAELDRLAAREAATWGH